MSIICLGDEAARLGLEGLNLRSQEEGAVPTGHHITIEVTVCEGVSISCFYALSYHFDCRLLSTPPLSDRLT